MKKMNKIVTIRIITIIMLICLPFLGSDCEDIINQIAPTTGELAGNWTLIYNGGTTLDVCPGEMVSYPSSTGGTASLTCPEQSPVDRDYSVSGTNPPVLTYTSSGMQYEVSFTQNNELVLAGINNNRILYYSTAISDKKPVVNGDKTVKNTSNYNSSEITK